MCPGKRGLMNERSMQRAVCHTPLKHWVKSCRNNAHTSQAITIHLGGVRRRAVWGTCNKLSIISIWTPVTNDFGWSLQPVVTLKTSRVVIWQLTTPSELQKRPGYFVQKHSKLCVYKNFQRTENSSKTQHWTATTTDTPLNNSHISIKEEGWRWVAKRLIDVQQVWKPCLGYLFCSFPLPQFYIWTPVN